MTSLPLVQLAATRRRHEWGSGLRLLVAVASAGWVVAVTVQNAVAPHPER
jgi:hypothetical protein